MRYNDKVQKKWSEFLVFAKKAEKVSAQKIVFVARKFPPIFTVFFFVATSIIYLTHKNYFNQGIDPVGMQEKWENGEIGALWPKFMYYYYFLTAFGGTWSASPWPQIVIVSLTFGFVFFRLLKIGVHPLLVTLCCVFLATFPGYVFFTLNTEKDTIATMACVLLFLFCVELVIDRNRINDLKFAIPFGLALFLTLEVRKNNLLIVLAIAVILLICFRSNLKKLAPIAITFSALIALFAVVLALTPMKKTAVSERDTVGAEAWVVSAVYGTNGTQIPDDLNAFFTSLGDDEKDPQSHRSADRWAGIWRDREAFMLSSDVARIGLHNPWTAQEAVDLIVNSARLCFVSPKNLSVCLSAFGEYAGSSWNPLAQSHDTFNQSTPKIISSAWTEANGIVAKLKAVKFAVSYLFQRYFVYNYAVQFWIFLAVAVSLLRKKQLFQLIPLTIPLASWLSLFCFAPVHQNRYYLTLILIFPLFLICLKRQTGYFSKIQA